MPIKPSEKETKVEDVGVDDDGRRQRVNGIPIGFGELCSTQHNR